MQYPQNLFLFTILLILFCSASNAKMCSNPSKIIIVDKSGRGTFKTIQSAINSVPINNSQWIHIKISQGTYAEKIQMPDYKPCIFLDGAGSSSTIIQWNDHIRMGNCTTFETAATNIIARGITFMNTYNSPPRSDGKGNVPAIAAKVEGDQTAFYDCTFKGVQDTLYDAKGRHYFHNCFIQGAVDFIYGDGQSIYEKCTVNYRDGPDGHPELSGFITAQSRASQEETSGFVFNKCTVTGVGKTHLGRGYRSFSRVIFANSYFSDVVDPEGWVAWNGRGQEGNLTYVEEGCRGPGANKSKRVPWMKHMDATELKKFVSLSYIDQDGWLSNRPSSF